MILDGVFDLLRAACPWCFLPDSFPPWRTGYRCFGELRDTAAIEGSTTIWCKSTG